VFFRKKKKKSISSGLVLLRSSTATCHLWHQHTELVWVCSAGIWIIAFRSPNWKEKPPAQTWSCWGGKEKKYLYFMYSSSVWTRIQSLNPWHPDPRQQCCNLKML